MTASDSGGFDQYHFTKEFWIDLLNVKKKDGRRCVDLALACSKEEAWVLKRWGATEQAPPPPPQHNEWAQGRYVRTQASGQDTQYDRDGDAAPAFGPNDPWARWQGSSSPSNSWNRWESSNHGGGRSSAGSNDWYAASGQVRGNVRRRKRREDVVGQYDHKTWPAELRAFGMYKYDDDIVTRNNHIRFSGDEDGEYRSESDDSTTIERYARRR